jgi:hypothetical protein
MINENWPLDRLRLQSSEQCEMPVTSFKVVLSRQEQNTNILKEAFTSPKMLECTHLCFPVVCDAREDQGSIYMLHCSPRTVSSSQPTQI